MYDSPFVDTDYLLQQCTINEFIGMHKEVQADCMDISNGVTQRVTDEQARELIQRISKCDNVAEFQKIEIIRRPVLETSPYNFSPFNQPASI